MKRRFALSLICLLGIIVNAIGFGASQDLAFAADVVCNKMLDISIPSNGIDQTYSVANPVCYRFNIVPGLTKLFIYAHSRRAMFKMYMGSTKSAVANIKIQTTYTTPVIVNTLSKNAFRPSQLTPGFLILALTPHSGNAHGDIIHIGADTTAPPAPAAPSSSGIPNKVGLPVGTGTFVEVSPAEPIIRIKNIGKAPQQEAPQQEARQEAPEVLPTSTLPPPSAEQPYTQPFTSSSEPAPSSANIDPFPCSRTGIGKSNLCIEQPYPVRRGATAYALWNISDFAYGEFDRGDGNGFKGPILNQMRVEVPDINAPRTIRLRWIDKTGSVKIDSFTIQLSE